MSVPYSKEVEQAVIGAIILDARRPNECLLQATNQLVSADFYLDSHRKLFAVMIDLGRNDQPIDYTTLPDALQRRGQLENIGGLAYIDDLVKWQLNLKNIERYCEILRRFSAQRQLIDAAELMMRQAEEQCDPGEIASRVQSEIDSVTTRIQSQNCIHVSAIGPQLCKRLIRDFDKEGDTVGLPTGIQRLDHSIGGLVEGELIVVAAHTGGGKTAFALNVIEKNCPNDVPVSVYSFEMDREALLMRLAAKRCGIPQIRLRNKAIDRDDLMQIMAEIKEIERWPLWIDDRSGMKPRELYASIRMQAARGAKLAVVDYIQLFADNCPGYTIREQVNNASECVRSAAKDSKIPILNLSQFARPSEKETPRKPTIYDLKESGKIEQDAHIAILLHREFEIVDNMKRATKNDSIIIGKNRSGPLIDIAAEFDGQMMQWSEKNSYIPQETYEHRYHQ